MFTKLKTMNDVGLFPVDCPKLLSLTALISIFTNFDSGGGTFGWPTDVQLDNSLLCWRSANKVNATLATHRAQPSLPNTRKYILYSRWRCAWKCPAPLFPHLHLHSVGIGTAIERVCVAYFYREKGFYDFFLQWGCTKIELITIGGGKIFFWQLHSQRSKRIIKSII